MTELRTHIHRMTAPPWRPAAHATECGQRIGDDGRTTAGADVLTHEEFNGFLKRHGQRRTAMLACMTCFDTARRYRAWAVDPISALNREVNAARMDNDHPLRHELSALAMLVDAHRDQFAALLEGLSGTDDLAAARRRRRVADAKR